MSARSDSRRQAVVGDAGGVVVRAADEAETVGQQREGARRARVVLEGAQDSAAVDVETLKIAESVYSRREVARMRQSCKGWRNALQVMLVGEIRRRWPGKREWAKEFAMLSQDDVMMYMMRLGTARMPGPDGGRVLRLKHVDYLEEHVEEEEFGEWHGE